MSGEDVTVDAPLATFMEAVVDAMNAATDLSDGLYRAVTPVAIGTPVFVVSAALLLVAYRQLHHGGFVADMDGGAVARRAAAIIRQGSETNAEVAGASTKALAELLAQFLSRAGVLATADAVTAPKGSA